jgi:hypothetical protein
MSDPGPVPTDVVPAAPEPDASSPRRRSRRIIGGVAVLALAAAGAVYVTSRGEGQSFPKKWDPRIADLVKFVQRERELDFKHPVEVVFMQPKPFEKLMSADESKLTADDRKQVEEQAAQLRALGLIGPDVNLLKSASDIQSTGTLAFYSFKDKKIRVRGTTLTPGIRVTVAHELTHVLQDQHFDLGRIQDERDSEKNDQAGDVLRGLAEGDADRIENAYHDSLSDADQKAADDESSAANDSFQADKYPPVLVAMFGAPYALGNELISVVDSSKGMSGIDKLFVKPPRFDNVLLDPLGYLAGDDGKALATPKAGKGEKELDHGGFGAFTLYLTLAQRLDARRAMAAADAWAGDAYLAYRASGKVCVRVTFRGSGAHGSDAIAAALAEWARPAPAGSAVVKRAGTDVVLQACDTKDNPPAKSGLTVDELFGVPRTRAELGTLVLRSHGTLSQARCFADRSIAEFTVDELQSATPSAAVTQRIQAIAQSCRNA